MKIIPIQTRSALPPKDDLYELILDSVKDIPEQSIFVVTSKIVAIHQGRCIPVSDVEDKDEVIKWEAEKYLPRSDVPGEYVMLTMKNNLLIPTAGIDESNAMGYYILWPSGLKEICKQIHEFLRREYRVKEIGVVITDSHTIPLRWGVMGISLAHSGFCPLKDYRGTKDIFGRRYQITLANVVDSIAAASVLVMGEGDEQTPLALVSDISFVRFGECEEEIPDLEIDPEIDIYAPLLKGVKWRKGGGGNTG